MENEQYRFGVLIALDLDRHDLEFRSRSSAPTHRHAGLPCGVVTPVGDT